MLILPIILWWADAPLRFAIGRSRVIVSIISVTALLTSSSFNQTAFAEDWFSGADSIASTPLIPTNGSWTVKSQTESDANLLREGTEIPAMDGRVIKLGRRWAFISMADETAHAEAGALTRNRLGRSSNDGLVAKPFFGKIRLVNTSPHSNKKAKVKFGSKEETASTNPKDGPAEKRSWILVENLMLQRVVEAIRADNNDDRWTLSGKVIEFFGENRMVIQTAQRSNAE